MLFSGCSQNTKSNTILRMLAGDHFGFLTQDQFVQCVCAHVYTNACSHVCNLYREMLIVHGYKLRNCWSFALLSVPNVLALCSAPPPCYRVPCSRVPYLLPFLAPRVLALRVPIFQFPRSASPAFTPSLPPPFPHRLRRRSVTPLCSRAPPSSRLP